MWNHKQNLQTAEIIPLTEAVILLREVRGEEEKVEAAEHPLSFKLNYLLILKTKIMNTNSIIENFKEIVTNKYAQFTGRANKTEFWKYILVYIIVSGIIYVIISWVE